MLIHRKSVGAYQMCFVYLSIYNTLCCLQTNVITQFQTGRQKRERENELLLKKVNKTVIISIDYVVKAHGCCYQLFHIPLTPSDSVKYVIFVICSGDDAQKRAINRPHHISFAIRMINIPINIYVNFN